MDSEQLQTAVLSRVLMSLTVGYYPLSLLVFLYEASIEHSLVFHKVAIEIKFTFIYSQKLCQILVHSFKFIQIIAILKSEI